MRKVGCKVLDVTSTAGADLQNTAWPFVASRCAIWSTENIALSLETRHFKNEAKKHSPGLLELMKASWVFRVFLSLAFFCWQGFLQHLHNWRTISQSRWVVPRHQIDAWASRRRKQNEAIKNRSMSWMWSTWHGKRSNLKLPLGSSQPGVAFQADVSHSSQKPNSETYPRHHVPVFLRPSHLHCAVHRLRDQTGCKPAGPNGCIQSARTPNCNVATQNPWTWILEPSRPNWIWPSWSVLQRGKANPFIQTDPTFFQAKRQRTNGVPVISACFYSTDFEATKQCLSPLSSFWHLRTVAVVTCPCASVSKIWIL